MESEKNHHFATLSELIKQEYSMMKQGSWLMDNFTMEGSSCHHRTPLVNLSIVKRGTAILYTS